MEAGFSLCTDPDCFDDPHFEFDPCCCSYGFFFISEPDRLLGEGYKPYSGVVYYTPEFVAIMKRNANLEAVDKKPLFYPSYMPRPFAKLQDMEDLEPWK